MPASKAQRAKTAERRHKAVEMRLSGLDWQTIADKLGYASRGAANKDVARAVDLLTREVVTAAAELRDLELLRLDRLQAAMWSDAMAGDDKAVRAILRIMDRRARLLGLDAAKTIKTVMTTELDERIAALTERMRQQAAAGR
jgi:hypothetical protein